MKAGIHPDYMECAVTCACGDTFKTRSTKPEIRVEICSKCHPFFTGRQKIVDTEGRVERFIKRYGLEKKYAATRGKSESDADAEAEADAEPEAEAEE